METVERFRKAYDYLYESGAIHTKKDLAEKMKVSRGSVQYAYAGNESYLNESFLKKFAKTFEAINLDWLLTGEGEMLKKVQETPKPNEMSNSSNNNISKLLEQNKELIDVLKKSLEESQRTNSILLNELAELRKELTSQKTELVESI